MSVLNLCRSSCLTLLSEIVRCDLSIQPLYYLTILTLRDGSVINMLAAKADELSFVPGTNMVGELNSQVVL